MRYNCHAATFFVSIRLLALLTGQEFMQEIEGLAVATLHGYVTFASGAVPSPKLSFVASGRIENEIKRQ
jgi:hypothetical protein